VKKQKLKQIVVSQDTGSANPLGWEHAQDLNEQFGGTVYIRGHMLNDNLHGPNSNWNLKPISQRMNREMDQKIENNAVREHKEKHKMLYYRATVKEYHKGDRNSTGAFPKILKVEWGHLLKEGKFDEKGIKITNVTNDYINYYNDKEIELIQNLTLRNPALNNARKWTLIECYTDQRDNDLVHLTEKK